MLVLLSTVSSGVAFSDATIILNENQILYLFSTSGQVIAAIYGLTLTGFIFFRNELSREEIEDETLVEAVESLKSRYFVLLAFITVLVILTILSSNLAIAYEGSGKAASKTLLLNVAQSTFVTSLMAVSYFIFDVIHPKRIELASKGLQAKVDPSRTAQAKGSLEDFLRNYNQIETLLEHVGKPFQETTSSAYATKYPRRLSNARLTDFLLRNGKVDKDLYQRLRELITLRNSIIHGADPVVSQDIVEASAKVLEELRTTLTEHENDEP
ncbi:hypothetical protein BON30_02920 [Cystobacter ferrugineus]|uniref:RiboL-PSP-HEPN domain-containing protein n=2 Tax=Cystobacter ferrugineus TaxID=83449 RepID=A0A1L9BIV9_9BACT|nr:hypothetical protein BON30_02920 [Cystobacter ferrugineus]